MTGLLVQIALGNLLISAALAGMAYVVHRRGRYPGLAHLLWVFVLIKLVTPPFLILPVAPIAGVGAAVPPQPLAGSAGTAGMPDPGAMVAAVTEHGMTALLLVWGLGSLVVLAVSLARIYRFDRSLRRTSREAPANIRQAADGMARHLGVWSAPVVLTSSARLSPMTWWTGGRVRIILPEALLRESGTEPLRWVLAHELAHVKRRDYLVRWLEFLACATFWWNPVAWWARQNLRFDEEASCDALVLERFGAEPRAYAGALLAVVEFLSRSTTRPPVLATGIDTQGSLERRFRVIISGRHVRSAPRWVVAGLVGAALLLTPLGIGSAAGPADVSGGTPQELAGEAVEDDPVDDTPVGEESPSEPLIEIPDVDGVALSDGYMMLKAELRDVVALDKVATGETRAKRAAAAEKAKRAARKAKRAVSEAKPAAKRAKLLEAGSGELDAPGPGPDDASALHGALIGLVAARLSDPGGRLR